MKLTTILFFLGYMQVSASAFSQTNELSLDMNHVEITKVLRIIEKKSDYRFLYNDALLSPSMRVDVNSKDASVLHIVNDVLSGTDLTYQLIGNKLIVIAAKNHRIKAVHVKGTVTDEDGNAIIGATVQVKEAHMGTVTDAQGHFEIDVPDDAVLVVSSLGYAAKEVAVNGQSSLNVVLQSSNTGLDELVVIGYGTQKKGDLTGAVSVINSDDVKDIPVGRADYIMQGKAAGVAITEQTGAPGDAIAVRIRGVGTINDNSPLYIIDGVPTKSGINNISPSDIESINILKDAASAAIYGSRASNGVVIVTTKHGKSGKTHVSLSNYTGVQARGHLIDMANTDQYVRAFNIAAKNDGRTQIPKSMIDTLVNVNWLKKILKPALISNTHLSVSGGNEKTQYRVSGTYFKQDGLIKNSSYDRFNILTGLTSELSDWITLGTNINIAYSKTRQVGTSGDGYGDGNPGASVVRYALFRTPATPVYNHQGKFVDLPNPASFLGDGFNPVGFADAYDRNFKKYTLLGHAYLELHPIKGLSLKTSLGTNLHLTLYKQFYKTWGIDRFINSPNSLARSVNNEFNYNWTNTATYKFNIDDKNAFNILVGSEAIKDDIKAFSASRTNFVNQDPNFQYLDNGLDNKLNGGNEAHWGLFSLFGRIGYTYNDKLFVNFNMRRDGSSRLSPSNRYGNFYSGSAAWRLDQENFIRNIRQISLLKLRFSLGELGNQNIGNYPYASLISGGSFYPFGGTPTEGYTITSKGNPDVKWETSTQTDIGLDAGFFNNAIQLTLDYFIKNTSNMLLSIPEPSSAGSAGSPTENAGKVRNSGLEVQVTYQGTAGTDFKYDLTGNFSTLRNEVISLAGGRPITGGRIDDNYYATLTKVEHPIGAFYLLQDVGIFQKPIDVITSAYQGPNIQPGDVKFKDVDKNGKIDQEDRTFVGSPIPKITYGFTGRASYKNFDLSLFFQGIYGNKIYNQVLTDIEGFYRPFNITKRIATKSWHGPGTSNKFPRLSWTGATNNKRPSTRFLESGSYLRLKNVQIGYTLGKQLLLPVKISSVRFFISAQNLLTFTKYTGLDPEMYISNNGLNDGVRAVGIDWGTYPSARTFTAGVNIDF